MADPSSSAFQQASQRNIRTATYPQHGTNPNIASKDYSVPPFAGSPPIPAGVSVNPQRWQQDFWQYNPAFASQPQEQPEVHVPWVPSPHWIPNAQGQPPQQQRSHQAASFNPYKRVPKPPSAEYLAMKLSDNPLGLSSMEPVSIEQYYKQGQSEPAGHTPWIWNPSNLFPEGEQDGGAPRTQSRPRPPESYTAKLDLQPVFSTAIVRTPDHYRESKHSGSLTHSSMSSMSSAPSRPSFSGPSSFSSRWSSTNSSFSNLGPGAVFLTDCGTLTEEPMSMPDSEPEPLRTDPGVMLSPLVVSTPRHRGQESVPGDPVVPPPFRSAGGEGIAVKRIRREHPRPVLAVRSLDTIAEAPRSENKQLVSSLPIDRATPPNRNRVPSDRARAGEGELGPGREQYTTPIVNDSQGDHVQEPCVGRDRAPQEHGCTADGGESPRQYNRNVTGEGAHQEQAREGTHFYRDPGRDWDNTRQEQARPRQQHYHTPQHYQNQERHDFSSPHAKHAPAAPSALRPGANTYVTPPGSKEATPLFASSKLPVMGTLSIPHTPRAGAGKRAVNAFSSSGSSGTSTATATGTAPATATTAATAPGTGTASCAGDKGLCATEIRSAERPRKSFASAAAIRRKQPYVSVPSAMQHALGGAHGHGTVPTLARQGQGSAQYTIPIPIPTKPQDGTNGNGMNTHNSPANNTDNIPASTHTHNPAPFPVPIQAPAADIFSSPLAPAVPRRTPRVRKGYWNSRGDHLTPDGYVVYAPPGFSNPPDLVTYPPHKEGYQDDQGQWCKWVPRPELPGSLPKEGKPAERPYRSFIIYVQL